MPNKRQSIITTRGQKKRRSEAKINDEEIVSQRSSNARPDKLTALEDRVDVLMEQQQKILGLIEGNLGVRAETTPQIGSPPLSIGMTRQSLKETSQVPGQQTAAETATLANPVHPARQGFPPPIQIGMPGSNPVNEAASAIVGAGTPFLYHVDLSDEPEPIPTHLYYKSSKPIAARVPQKIKDTICADQFVDLASLTDANMGGETTVSGYVPVGGGFYKPISKRKASQITNIASLPVTGRCPWEKMDQELYTRSMLRIGTMPRGIGLARAEEVSWNVCLLVAGWVVGYVIWLKARRVGPFKGKVLAGTGQAKKENRGSQTKLMGVGGLKMTMPGGIRGIAEFPANTLQSSTTQYL